MQAIFYLSVIIMLMDQSPKTNTQKLLLVMHLIKINILSSLAILILIVVAWTLLLASVASFFGIIAAGLGVHNFIALILAFVCFKFIGSHLADKEVQGPYRISFIYILLFVMSLASIALIRTKTGFINVDPEIVGFKYIPDVVVYIFCILIGTVSIPIMALLQRYRVTSFLILLLPAILFIYSTLYFVDWNSLPRYSINNADAETVRKHESLKWYIAPTESFAGLAPAETCEIVEGMKEVTCEYRTKERNGNNLLTQTTAKYHQAMDEYFENDNRCSVWILTRIAQSEFGSQYRVAEYAGKFEKNKPCSSFLTTQGTAVYFEIVDTTDKYKRSSVYFRKADTVVLLDMNIALGALDDEAFQKQLGAYIDSFR